ncbi:DUF4435 domain-containing protein [Desulfobulbus sp. US1]|nr:DUF4435 domain-containing protein [Desulfobulbus sp. US1]
MNNEPLIVVEGCDDIHVYSKFCEIINKKCKVIAIELLRSCHHEGCSSVLDALEYIRPLVNDKPELENLILGIIDRDARYYRNEIPNNNLLLILEKYSIESHFVTDQHLEYFISFITKIGMKLPDETLSLLNEYVFSGYNNLYYTSLEALKNACITEYQALVGYSYAAGRIMSDNQLQETILEKKNSLDDFAITKNISCSFDILFKITKGKWLIRFFCFKLRELLGKLPELCNSNQIQQCCYCEKGLYSKCLYKTSDNYQERQIETILLNKINKTDIQYILDRISLLA